MLFRRGKALSLKGDFEAAEADFNTTVEVDPDSRKDVDAALAANARRRQNAEQKQRQEMRSFLSRET